MQSESLTVIQQAIELENDDQHADLKYINSADVLSAWTKLTGTERENAKMILGTCAERKHKKTSLLNLLKAADDEAAAERLTSYTGGMTRLSGVEEQLRCGMYSVTDDSVDRYDPKNGSYMNVSHTAMIPTEYMENLEDGTQRVRISYMVRGWRDVVVERKDLATKTAITTLSQYGMDVTSENARYVVDYFATMEALNRDTIKHSLSTGRLGWHEGYGFAPYLENISFEKGQFAELYEAVQSRGEYEKWLEVVSAARKESVIFHMQLAASFASPLLSKLGGLPFFCHLWGGTSAGKTVALMAAASVWGNPNPGKYMRTMNGTSAGLEYAATFLCHMPLCLNEYQALKDKGGTDNLIYSLAEGQGKTRSTRNGGLRHSGHWCLSVLTNGEQPIAEGGNGAGALNRTIDVECGGKLFSEPKRIADTVRANYGHAGRKFIEYVAGLEPDELRTMYDTAYESFDPEIPDKQRASGAYIVLADRLSGDSVFSVGKDDPDSLDYKDVEKFLREEREVINKFRSIEYIDGWIAANAIHFDPGREIEIWGKSLGQTNGRRRYAIIPEILKGALNRANFSYSAFLSDAASVGLIESDISGKRQKVVRIGDSAVRCVVYTCYTGDYET